jgi:hypothetical protein
MAKLSVYIPDELLDEAKRLEPDFRPSKLFQEALRCLVLERTAKPDALLTDDLERERDEVRRIVLDQLPRVWSSG